MRAWGVTDLGEVINLTGLGGVTGLIILLVLREDAQISDERTLMIIVREVHRP